MVTVMVTSHEEKDIKDSGRITSYNVCNTWLFRVG